MSPITEGTVKKGGQNSRPTTPRPPRPQGQKASVRTVHAGVPLEEFYAGRAGFKDCPVTDRTEGVREMWRIRARDPEGFEQWRGDPRYKYLIDRPSVLSVPDSWLTEEMKREDAAMRSGVSPTDVCWYCDATREDHDWLPNGRNGACKEFVMSPVPPPNEGVSKGGETYEKRSDAAICQDMIEGISAPQFEDLPSGSIMSSTFVRIMLVVLALELAVISAWPIVEWWLR